MRGVKVGDWVEFKYDIEQSAKVEKIANGRIYVRAYEGDYVNNQTGTVISLRFGEFEVVD